MDERKRVIAQIMLMFTGLAMIVAGLLILTGVIEIGGDRNLVSWVLIGGGIGDLVVSWFVFRKPE